MKKSKKVGGICAAGVIAGAPFFLPPTPADAGEGGAFVGGLLAGHVITNMANQQERQTRAAERQADMQQQQLQQQQLQQQQQAAQKSEPTVEERLNTLDKLAANGMITKEEYQRRRKAIIDGI